MKALFLAGGMGTRLRPMTNYLPKPMLPLFDHPLIEQNINWLISYGIKEFIISIHYKPEVFEKRLNYFEKLGVKISYLVEEFPLGTAGAIKNAEIFLNETFLVLNADILTNLNISDMLKYHKEKGTMVTLGVTRVNNPSNFGVVETNHTGLIASFKEKPHAIEDASNYINAGLYFMEPSIFKYIPGSQSVSIERETFPTLLNEHDIAAYFHQQYWIDIGTPERYIQAHMDILDGKTDLRGYKFNTNHQFISKHSIIHPTANIVGPVYIGDNAQIDANSVIGPYSILGFNSHISMGTRVERSLFWPNTQAEKGSIITDSIICNTTLANNIY